MSIVTSRPGEGVTRISLNRPAKRNALDNATRDQLGAAIDDALSDPAVRAIILAGEGGNFCAGGDLREVSALDGDAARQRLKANHRIVRALRGGAKPVVAAVAGKAMGAGAGLALCADVLVVAESSLIGFGFLKLGLVPDWGIAYSLPQRLGVARARKAILLSETFTAKEALAAGVADIVAADADLEATALEIASTLAKLPTGAVDLARQQFATPPAGLDMALESEALAQAMRLTSPDFQKSVVAFLAR